MLIYDILKKDHQVVLDLLKRMEESSENAIKLRMDLLGRFRNELIPHTRAEEKVLYDTLKEINETEDIALEAYEEHHAVELILRELEAIEPSDERWKAKLNVLKENLEHHIEEEEGEMFDYAQQVLAPEEAEMMAEAFKNLKADVSEGSIVQSALEKIAEFMPARFAHRFSDFSRRI